MRKKLLVGEAALLAATVGVVLAAGARAPERHVARVSVRLKTSPAELFAIVSEVAAWPSWNPEVDAVARLPDRDGHAVWALSWGGDVIPSEVLEATPPSGAAPGRLVTRIADPELPFGGTWTWELAPDGAGTRVTIVEDGVIRSVVFRGISSLLLGYTSTPAAYLDALAARVGEAGAPREERVSFPVG